VRRLIGIVEEGKEVMEEFEDSQALESGVLAAAQAVEHSSVASFSGGEMRPKLMRVAVRPGPSKR